ncbi:MAG TPA: hypothetical protein VME46_21610 [Acidimicrobiales bacterium]|nr:hypothetical protein [Acidimicrobiales bacterium]
MSSRWALTERFVITDPMGNPLLEVRGNFGLVKHIKFHDQTGRVLAELKKHLVGDKYEVILDGRAVAEVKHHGLFGQHYEIATPQGKLEARGDFLGWQYSLGRGGAIVAQVSRQPSFREAFFVETAPGENDVFLLACILAIDNIHDERREHEQGMGGMGMGMGMGGVGFP